ncbi:unnamed protein product [Schistosoma guineensis]|nr:unnamed protein product [Schistosoma guineensis]
MNYNKVEALKRKTYLSIYSRQYNCIHYIYTNNNLMDKLTFTKPCPEDDYRFHNATGNFLCVVPTAKLCFKLCQKFGCTEWYYMSFIPSGSNEIKDYHRCRCFPEYRFCFYNAVPRRYRNFD